MAQADDAGSEPSADYFDHSMIFAPAGARACCIEAGGDSLFCGF
jgi:hypothetical protein